MSEDEFWITIAIWLLRQLKKGNRSDLLKSGELEEIEGDVKMLMTEDRFQELKRALVLDEEAFYEQIAHFRTSCADVIIPGKLLPIDESIFNSHSKAASRLGMLRFIENKPHPKGYFFHGALQKFVKSKTIFVLDLEMKWHHESPSMKECLLNIVSRCEKVYNNHFIVLTDSGYPASRIIEDFPSCVKSKFIASVSISHLSGSLRCLAEAGIATLKQGHPILLRRKNDGLLAFLCKKPNYTQCLVTNVWNESIDGPKKDVAVKLNVHQALALTQVFSVQEMIEKLGLPAASETEIRYPFKYLHRISGVDLTTPLDSEGYVSSNSLLPFSMQETRQIAELLGIKITHLKKEQLIAAILQRHPRANHSLQIEATKKKKKRVSPTPINDTSLKQLKQAFNQQSDRLLQKTSAPSFVKLYTENYGLQDRMNELIYGVFRHQVSKGVNTKYTWALLYIMLINSSSLWKEWKTLKPGSGDFSPQFEVGQKALVKFAWKVVKQIVAVYIETNSHVI